MGLGGLKTAWQRQTLHFGHEHRDRYSVLVYDNRGIGDSGVPLMRYSTSEMARDLIEVLSSIDWLPASALSSPSTPIPSRSLNVVGTSMGGMIAQELACLIPGYISSLSLVCTAAAIENTTSFTENMANRASMLMPKSIDRSVSDAAYSMFSHAWLVQPDDAHLPSPAVTPKCKPPAGPPSASPPTATGTTPAPETHVPASGEYLRFQTNGHRFVAQEMSKRLDRQRFTVKGFLLQLIAAGWHHKSKEQLSAMADAVGRERIFVVHGDEDRMISLPHGRKLIEYIQPGVAEIVKGMGHAPLVERTDWLHGKLEEMCRTGERLDGREV